ncbi:MAG: class I SAM-dependent methyltransferase [Pyrinomonadaceae bacterium]
MINKDHWESIYSTKPLDGVSWFQEHAEVSVGLITSAEIGRDAAIIDVGAGASVLVDDLLELGYHDISVLDLSGSALEKAKARLGKEKAEGINWIEADVTTVDLGLQRFDVWHDRAVFHFLTDEESRERYVENVMRSVKPGGYVIVATFAEDGPTKCSGLTVNRYSADELHAEFGARFELIKSEKEDHNTPFGTEQKFVYCFCLKKL